HDAIARCSFTTISIKTTSEIIKIAGTLTWLTSYAVIFRILTPNGVILTAHGTTFCLQTASRV
ncbi:hypothetical protein JI435_400770, partial [Parastagonospora nodorum SN15]